MEDGSELDLHMRFGQGSLVSLLPVYPLLRVWTALQLLPFTVGCSPGGVECIVGRDKHGLHGKQTVRGQPPHSLTIHVCFDGRRLCFWHFLHTMTNGSTLAIAHKETWT
jgi:hypothetical protein